MVINHLLTGMILQAFHPIYNDRLLYAHLVGGSIRLFLIFTVVKVGEATFNLLNMTKHLQRSAKVSGSPNMEVYIEPYKYGYF